MPVTVKDLLPEESRRDAFLWCPVCDSRYSASPGDYFWMSATDVFECCGEDNLYVRARESFEIIGGPANGEWMVRS